MLINVVYHFVFLPNKIEPIASIEFDWVSVIELNRTHKKVPVRLCSIAEPIELQSNDWVRLGSIGFWFGFVRLATPGLSELSERKKALPKYSMRLITGNRSKPFHARFVTKNISLL